MRAFTARFGWLLACVALSACPVNWSIPPDFDAAGPTDSGGAGGAGGGSGGGAVGGGGAGNLPPRFEAAGNVTLDEDAPVVVAVTGVTAGSAAEDAVQQVSLSATAQDATLLTATVAGAGATRTLRLAPARNLSGQTDVTLAADDGAGGTSQQTVHVTVRPVNDPPTVDVPADARVNSPNVLTVHLAGLGPGGGADEVGQPLSVTVSAADPSLFTSLTAGPVAAGGCDLSLTPDPTHDGITTVTATVSDGQSANATTGAQFHVMVNQTPPSLTFLGGAAGAVSGCVSLTVTVVDAKSLPVDVLLEVNQGPGYVPGTLQLGGATALSSSPTGVQHTVVWRSSSDVVGVDAPSVSVRAFAARSGFHGNGSALGPLAVNDAVGFAPRLDFPGGLGAFQARPYDLDHDGWLDVVTADSFGQGVSVMRGLTDGGFAAPVPYDTAPAMCGSQPPKPFSVDVGDLNGDGREDLLAVHQFCNTVGVVLAQSDGGYGPFTTFSVGDSPLFGTLADLNHDGALDYAVVNLQSADVSVLLGRGDGTFLPEQRVKVGLDPSGIDRGDFNLDGNEDLVTADALDDAVTLLYGDGDGGFTRRDFPAGPTPRSLGVADFNADGFPDLATANPGPNNDQHLVEVLLSDGDGGFQAPATYTTGEQPRSVGVGDYNLDGRPDFVTGNVNADTVAVFVNGGKGVFLPGLQLSVGGGPRSVFAGDFDHDGRLDVVSGDTAVSAFSVLRNASPVCGP